MAPNTFSPLLRIFAVSVLTLGIAAVMLSVFTGYRISATETEKIDNLLKYRVERVSGELRDAAEKTRDDMRAAARFAARKVRSDADLSKLLAYFVNKRGDDISADALLPWEYMSWFDMRTGDLYVSDNIDSSVFTPLTVGDLAAASADRPYATVFGKVMFGAAGNYSTIPAAMTVQNGKGGALGTLIVGLRSDNMASNAVKQVSPDFNADIAVLDEDFFIISATGGSISVSANGDLLDMLRGAFAEGDLREGTSAVSALRPEQAKFRFLKSDALPVLVAGGYDGAVMFDNVWTPAALAGGAIALFAGVTLFLAFMFRKRVLLPYGALSQAAARIAEGKSPGMLPGASYPEAAPVSSQLRKVVRYHKELREARDALDESHNLVKSALRYITHELKTPLTQIMGFSEIMLNGAGRNMPPEQKEYIRLIHEAARMQHTLIGSFTEQIREQDGGAEELRAEPCDLYEVVKYYVAIFAGRASDKHVNISVETAPDLPELRADQAKLGNIILNLASNAIKYNVVNGSVVFRVAQSADGRYINLCCEDTGIGIAKENIKKIFRPFTRLYNEQTAHIDGAGLGLSYVRRIVSQHGGYVTVESEPGKGSRFTCHFPLTSYRQNAAFSAPVRKKPALRALPAPAAKPAANSDGGNKDKPIPAHKTASRSAKHAAGARP